MGAGNPEKKEKKTCCSPLVAFQGDVYTYYYCCCRYRVTIFRDKYNSIMVRHTEAPRNKPKQQYINIYDDIIDKSTTGA